MSLAEFAGVALWTAIVAGAWWWAHLEHQAARRQREQLRRDRHFARQHRVP